MSKKDEKPNNNKDAKIKPGKSDELDEKALDKVSGGAPPFGYGSFNDGKHGPH